MEGKGGSKREGGEEGRRVKRLWGVSIYGKEEGERKRKEGRVEEKVRGNREMEKKKGGE